MGEERTMAEGGLRAIRRVLGLPTWGRASRQRATNPIVSLDLIRMLPSRGRWAPPERLGMEHGPRGVVP